MATFAAISSSIPPSAGALLISSIHNSSPASLILPFTAHLSTTQPVTVTATQPFPTVPVISWSNLTSVLSVLVPSSSPPISSVVPLSSIASDIPASSVGSLAMRLASASAAPVVLSATLSRRPPA